MPIKPLLADIIYYLDNFQEHNAEMIAFHLTVLQNHLEDDSVIVTEDDISVLGPHGRKAALLGFVAISLQALQPQGQ